MYGNIRKSEISQERKFPLIGPKGGYGQFDEVELKSNDNEESYPKKERWTTVEINGVHYNRWIKNNVQPSDLPGVPKVDRRRSLKGVGAAFEDEDEDKHSCTTYIKENFHYLVCTLLMLLALIFSIVLYSRCDRPVEKEELEFTVRDVNYENYKVSSNISLPLINSSITPNPRIPKTSSDLSTTTTTSSSSTTSTTTTISSTTKEEKRSTVRDGYFPVGQTGSRINKRETGESISKTSLKATKSDNLDTLDSVDVLTSNCVLPLVALVTSAVALFVTFIIITVTFANLITQE